MAKKIQSIYELRKRQSIDCSEPKLTDQSDKKNCDINVIVERFNRTGVLPHIQNTGEYIDNTKIPQTLTDALDHVIEFREFFESLPVKLRKEMNFDPRNYEAFVNNPDNYDILKKNGLIIEKEKKDESISKKPVAPDNKNNSKEGSKDPSPKDEGAVTK